MILITGASGNVGREVLKQIAETGSRVRAAFQSSRRVSDVPSGVEVAIMDYNQPQTVRHVLQDVDRVFLVGPVAASLTELERKATDEIRRSGVHHIVKLSAMGPRDVTFPRQHAESEDYIRSSGLGFTFLRPNGFMQNMAIYNGATIRAQSAFYASQGEGRVSHIDIRDIAAVAVKTLTEDTHLGKVYTLTGPEALSNTRMAEILSRTLGREIKYVDLDPEQMRQALLAVGTPEWSANGILELNGLYRRGGASTVSPDVELVLARKPIPFEQYARDEARKFQAESGSMA